MPEDFHKFFFSVDVSIALLQTFLLIVGQAATTLYKMERLGCLLLLLFVVQATLADDCAKANGLIMQCFMANPMDFENADPSNPQEMCSKVQKLVECGNQAQEMCDSLPNELTTLLDNMEAGAAQLCGGGGGGCNTLEADAHQCFVQFHQQGRPVTQVSELCEAVDGLRECLDDIMEGCPSSDMQGSAVEQIMQTVGQYESLYNCNSE